MQVCCLGDSNTYGYDPRSYFGDRYPKESRWVNLLSGKTGWAVLNEGENGRRIPRSPVKLSCGLDLLIVMLGTNDILQGSNADAAANHMEDFLKHLPLEDSKILLVAPPPMVPGTWTDARLIDTSRQLAVQYQEVARHLGIRFGDAGLWKVDLTFDGVHFSEAGHRAFADGIYSLLKKW